MTGNAVRRILFGRTLRELDVTSLLASGPTYHSLSGLPSSSPNNNALSTAQSRFFVNHRASPPRCIRKRVFAMGLFSSRSIRATHPGKGSREISLRNPQTIFAEATKCSSRIDGMDQSSSPKILGHLLDTPPTQSSPRKTLPPIPRDSSATNLLLPEITHPRRTSSVYSTSTSYPSAKSSWQMASDSMASDGLSSSGISSQDFILQPTTFKAIKPKLRGDMSVSPAEQSRAYSPLLPEPSPSPEPSELKWPYPQRLSDAPSGSSYPQSEYSGSVSPNNSNHPPQPVGYQKLNMEAQLPYHLPPLPPSQLGQQKERGAYSLPSSDNDSDVSRGRTRKRYSRQTRQSRCGHLHPTKNRSSRLGQKRPVEMEDDEEWEDFYDDETPDKNPFAFDSHTALTTPFRELEDSPASKTSRASNENRLYRFDSSESNMHPAPLTWHKKDAAELEEVEEFLAAARRKESADDRSLSHSRQRTQSSDIVNDSLSKPATLQGRPHMRHDSSRSGEIIIGRSPSRAPSLARSFSKRLQRRDSASTRFSAFYPRPKHPNASPKPTPKRQPKKKNYTTPSLMLELIPPAADLDPSEREASPSQPSLSYNEIEIQTSPSSIKSASPTSGSGGTHDHILLQKSQQGQLDTIYRSTDGFFASLTSPTNSLFPPTNPTPTPEKSPLIPVPQAVPVPQLPSLYAGSSNPSAFQQPRRPSRPPSRGPISRSKSTNTPHVPARLNRAFDGARAKLRIPNPTSQMVKQAKAVAAKAKPMPEAEHVLASSAPKPGQGHVRNTYSGSAMSGASNSSAGQRRRSSTSSGVFEKVAEKLGKAVTASVPGGKEKVRRRKEE